jgi:eukaryotic-like serine/threonine-protein kinase
MFGELKAGTVIAGKFRVERVLGQGNMGVVVLATHLQLDQQVALKFLLPSSLAQAEVEARFAQEARAAAKIKSEHVVRVLDVSTLDSGEPYIVMEYLEGTDLAKQLARRGPMTVQRAVASVLQVCEALAEAHAAGIVHRDLKLSNLFVASYPDGQPCIKILDFGISKYSIPGSDPDLSMTDTAAVMGSPLYMSPEQMRSTRNVDGRSDIWALGIILYELVAGRVPFDAQTMPLLCSMVLQDEPPSLGARVRDLPRGFEAVVMRCLAKDRNQRFQSVQDLAVALAEFAPPEAQRSVQRIARLATGGPASAKPADTLQLDHVPLASTVHPHRRGWIAGALAVASVAVAAALWRWGTHAAIEQAGQGPTESLPAAASAPAPAVPLPPPAAAPTAPVPAVTPVATPSSAASGAAAGTAAEPSVECAGLSRGRAG